MTLDELTVNFAHLDRLSLIEDWAWLVGTTRIPILVTAIGDAFLQDTDTGSITLLSCGPCEIQDITDSYDNFLELLSDHDFVTEHFVPSLVLDLREAGISLKEGELYGYKEPPSLGGEYALENLEPTDISVHFATLGQIGEATAQLENGTVIDRMEFSEPKL